MCRLLGYAAPRPTTVAAVLGGGDAQVFRDMARLHRDGWGTAWTEGPVEVEGMHSVDALDAAISPRSGQGDPDLERTLAHESATSRIVHLRLASDGMVCAPQNTHPFIEDGLAFAHNGSLEPVELIDALVSPSRADEVQGSTDSERYFAAIRSRSDEGRSTADAVISTVRSLRERFPTRSLNALLLTPHELIAVHASRETPIPHQVFAASGLRAAELPQHHQDAYYLMRVRRLQDGTVVFASSGLDIAGWEALPAECVARVDLETLELTVTELEPTTGAERSARRVA